MPRANSSPVCSVYMRTLIRTALRLQGSRCRHAGELEAAPLSYAHRWAVQQAISPDRVVRRQKTP